MTQEATSSGPKFGVRPLDYDKAAIQMRVDTQIESDYRIVACRKEPWTVEFIERQLPGTILIDVGANVGPYTLVAVACGLRPVAIEPHFRSYAKLCENLALNNWLDRAVPMCMALSNRTSFDWFYYNDMAAGSNQHTLGKANSGFHRQWIPIMRLDDLMPLLELPEGPIALKIDVDGFEDLVLQGAAETLRGDRIRAMIIELNRLHAEKLLGDLYSMGWKVTLRVDETTNLGNETDKHFGRDRFRDMFYVQLEK